MAGRDAPTTLKCDVLCQVRWLLCGTLHRNTQGRVEKRDGSVAPSTRDGHLPLSDSPHVIYAR